MKKIKLILMIALLGLSYSCKKEEMVSENSQSAIPENQSLKSNKGIAEANDDGGTIGCFINFTDPLSSGFHNNDSYDSCMDGVLVGTNVLGDFNQGPPKPIYPAPECFPCMVPPVDKVNLMEYYWGLLGITQPQTDAEYLIARNKLAIYNTVITSVFTNSNGELEITDDRSIRRSQLLTYAGTLPEGIIDYVDFVYGKYFAIEVAPAAKLFYDFDSEGNPIASHPYGVKVNGNIIEF